MKPRLLDLYCGAGGAGMGYHRAGFEVVGVDLHPQKNYPFEFHQADAMTYPLEGFDAIHASPPCQAYSTTRTLHTNEYPELIGLTRERLRGRLYVMENVVGAPLDPWVQLCGSSFGLAVRRHRRFESSVLWLGPCCRHDLQPFPLDVTGTGGPGGRHRKPKNLAQAREAMGIDWMTRPELSEAIPPAYTEYIGRQLLVHLESI